MLLSPATLSNEAYPNSLKHSFKLFGILLTNRWSLLSFNDSTVTSSLSTCSVKEPKVLSSKAKEFLLLYGFKNEKEDVFGKNNASLSLMEMRIEVEEIQLKLQLFS